MQISPNSYPRIDWIDISKAYGMILVFYGHLWFSFPNDMVWIQNKLIYSFHMPLFFILAGISSKKTTEKFGAFFKKKLVTRIIPAILFSLLLLLCQILISIHFQIDIPFKQNIWGYLERCLKGKFYSRITWFLTCLFTVELINFFISPLTSNNKKRWLSVFCFYCLGFIITWKINIISTFTKISPNFWYIHEALIAYSFYQFGVVLKNTKWLTTSINKITIKYLFLIISITILLLTFNLNQGFFDPNFRLVLMISSIHGHPVFFLVSALAGSMAIIFLSHITLKIRILLFWGQNTLVLLGLNGIFRDIINPKLNRFIPQNYLTTNFKILLFCLSVTLVSMIVCIPFIQIYNKFYPRLINQPITNLFLKGKIKYKL